MKSIVWSAVRSLLLGMMLVTGVGVLPRAAQAQAGTPVVSGGAGSIQAADALTIPFYPRTIATYDVSSGLAGPGWLQTSGSWAAYALAVVGCGHCGTYLVGLHLINLLNTHHIDIRTASWGYPYSSSGAPVGMGSIVFAGSYLVWTQPGPTVPQGYNYAPGDYDCTVCYYNVDTGQGGSATALASLQTIDPQGRTNLQLLDADQFGIVLAVVRGAPDRLWSVNLATGTQQQVATVAPALNVKEAVLYHTGSGAAWLEGTDLYAADPNAPRHLVASGVTALRATHDTLFWHQHDGIYMEGQPQPKLIAPAGADFSPSDSQPGIGVALAWVDSQTSGAGTLNVVSVNPADPNPPALLRQSLPTALHDVHLAYDHLVYIAEIPTNDGPPIENIELVWLTLPVPAFAQVWTRGDAAVAAGTAPRSWLWGPAPRYSGYESFTGSSAGIHQVLYYDKARMELNNPYGDRNDPSAVTNGLLTVEMISGAFQVGVTATVTAGVPCTIPVAGDPRKDNPLTPDYATLAGVASLHGDHQAPNRIGQPVNDTMDVHGVVSTDAAHGALARYAAFASQTGHNIPDVFWTYLQGMPATYGFDWTFVLGYPITEGYWTQMRVGGKDYPVLIQAYQRRVLTYVPDFAPAWQIQQGNVGQHYLEWRYTLNR